MVIGNGLVADAFAEYIYNNKIIVFASGVSNSIETNKSEFKREFRLLKEIVTQNPDKKFIYFSTCSIEDASVNERPYIQHKLKIESFIQTYVNDYLIFRTTNIVGFKGNSKTIMNFLVNAINNENQIDIWKYSERNLIDKDDLKFIVDNVIQSNRKNEIVNIAFRKSIAVIEIVKLIESHLGKKAIVNLVDKGCPLKVDTNKISDSLDIIEQNKGIGLNYIISLLTKYY